MMSAHALYQKALAFNFGWRVKVESTVPTTDDTVEVLLDYVLLL
jgi:hypothetical protein